MSQSGEYCDMLYYNKSHFAAQTMLRLCGRATTVRQERVCSLDGQLPDWSQVLFDKQVVVLEVLETAIDALDWGFCQQAIHALNQLPEQYPHRGPLYNTARTPMVRHHDRSIYGLGYRPERPFPGGVSWSLLALAKLIAEIPAVIHPPCGRHTNLHRRALSCMPCGEIRQPRETGIVNSADCKLHSPPAGVPFQLPQG